MYESGFIGITYLARICDLQRVQCDIVYHLLNLKESGMTPFTLKHSIYTCDSSKF